MELVSIKNTIKKKIDISIELINKLRQMCTITINIKPTQVNFEIGKIIKNKQITSFIKTLIKIYEENANKFQKLFCFSNFISANFIGILDKLTKNLNAFSKINDSIFYYDYFKDRERNLDNFQIKELNKLVDDKIKKYNEDKKKIFKEYQWRNIEELDILIRYLNNLLSAMNNIKNLGQVIPKAINDFRGSQELFTNENTIMKGKYIISNSFRQILVLLDNIDDLFTEVEKNEEKRRENPFFKLNNMVEVLKIKYNEIYNQIKEVREKYNKINILNNFDLKFKELKEINELSKALGKKMIEINATINNEYNNLRTRLNSIRIDILIMLDITSSMESYIYKFKEQFYPMIENIAKECPEDIIYVGFIGYKDIEDKNLGDDYIDIDFTVNYDKLKDIINKIEPDGGDDIPEDVTGAFELGLKKSWKGNKKIAFLITDSPCHGSKYHNLNKNQPEEIDKYLSGNENKIEEVIREFFEKNITLFCLDLHKNTHKMFDIFKEKFDEMEIPEGGNKFFIEKENFWNSSTIKKIKSL